MWTTTPVHVYFIEVVHPYQSVGLRQCSFSLLDNRRKSSLLIYSQVSQDFTVDFDLSFFQASDEAAVGQTVDTCSSVDTCDPQCAELTLALTTVTVRILTSFDDSLFGNSEYTATSTVVTFGLFQDFLVTGASLYTTFYARHGNSSF
eukprot:Anaeramoba_flamelloidesc42128_g1_i4.p1 GENE.c42128_g1_i4~~c42128_g1_i4.p1  ORF type:complete len:147 (+),score=0.09 c42128_g1_i4:94-534(+)